MESKVFFLNDSLLINLKNKSDYSEDSIHYGNIMYDRRVIRGNTYALHTLPAVIKLKYKIASNLKC